MTLDSQILEQLLFERYRSESYIETRKVLEDAVKALSEKLLRMNDTPTKRQLDALYKSLNKEIRTAYSTLPANLAKESAAIKKLIWESNVGSTVPIVEIKSALRKELQIQGYDYNDLFKNTSRQHINRLKASIASGIARGASLDEIVRDVRHINKTMTKSNLKTVVNTTVAQARADGRYAAYQQLEQEGDYYTFVATLDSRTSSTCRPLDGKKYYKPLSEVPNRPPLHWNCRSLLTLTPQGYGPATRASKDGQVPANISYNQWFKGQSEKVQKTVLGTAGYAAYTAGTLDTTSFTSASSSSLSLEQIQEQLKPIIYEGKSTTDRQIIAEMALRPLINGGLQLGTPKFTKLADKLVLTAIKKKLNYAVEITKSAIKLRLIDLPASMRGKGTGTEVLNSLMALKEITKSNKLIIRAGGRDYPDSVFRWLKGGRVKPENAFTFNKNLVKTLKYEYDYDDITLMDVEGYLSNNNYKALLSDKKFATDLRRALKGIELDLIVIK